MIPFFVACLVFGVLFVVIEVISRTTPLLKDDDSRKAVHIIAGLIAACLPTFISFTQIAGIGIFFIAFMMVSKKFHLFPSIHGVERITFGEVYYPLAIAIIAWLFPVPTVYCYAVLILAVSDGFAAVIGKRIGKHPFSVFGANKSLEGSAIFWLISFLITVCTLSMQSMSLAALLGTGFLVTSVLTLVEASFTRGLDNLFVPLAAALFIMLL